MDLDKPYVDKIISQLELAIDSIQVKETAGNKVLKMVQNYLSDAKYFLQEGEVVKALAAAEYAHGLLDGGVGSEVFEVQKNPHLFVF